METTVEIPAPSLDGTRRAEFYEVGLTDAVILEVLARRDLEFWLLTADRKLAVQAEMLGYEVMNFNHLR